MRFTPLVGTKAWFGPRRFGWGWDPVSWEGWAVLGAFVAVSVVSSLADTTAALAVMIVATVAVLASVVAKGTSPGGPSKRDRFLEHRRLAGRTAADVEAARRERRRTEDEPSVADAAERLRRNRP